jgi:hypothetical protein
MEERLEHIRKKIKAHKVYYSRYSPQAHLMYEIEDAGDDMLWMIHEIERLRKTLEERERKRKGGGVGDSQRSAEP